MEKLEKNVVHTSLSEIVQRQAYKTLPKTGNIIGMIIKPKKNQTIDITKQDLRNNINLAELKVGIRGDRGTKNGDDLEENLSHNIGHDIELFLGDKNINFLTQSMDVITTRYLSLMMA
ncbi:hypothetical protein WA026_012292 [Henosepilachna vigintioctopunctata]|uniref:Uncharacterized protein n=1 Tax=Henosepilachna vigintioctopunctata TaxID=420089 RepID=A0AAW1V094_9CUCU